MCSYLFHYMSEDGIIYLCMADQAFGRRIPFAYLQDICQRFRSAYGDKGKTAIAYAFDSEFSKILAKQMNYYSNDPSADKLTEVKGELAAVKDVMVSNLGTCGRLLH